MIPLLAAIPAALSAMGAVGGAAGGAAAGSGAAGGLLGSAGGLMGGASGLMSGAASGLAEGGAKSAVDWAGMDDMGFMKAFGDSGYDQDAIGEDGQARLKKFMADDAPASPYATMNIAADNQRGLSAVGQYQNMGQSMSPQGLMSMAVAGIQREPNVRRGGLMGYGK